MSHIQLQLALDFIARLDARDHALADLLSESFTHRFLPASLKGFGIPSRNKQQFLDFAKGLKATFQSINFQPPLEIIRGQDVVVLHLVSDGQTISGKPYNNEYMITFHFEGEKIASVEEFLDSKYVTEILEGEKNVTSGP